MLYFGEKLISIWIWSGQASASIISISFCSHSLRSIWPISFLIWPYITILRYFGANTTWYWHLHVVWLKLSTSLLFFISKTNLSVPRMWLANPHSILRGGFSLSRAKAVFIPPAKLVVVARSSYPRTTGKASGGMLCPFYIPVCNYAELLEQWWLLIQTKSIEAAKKTGIRLGCPRIKRMIHRRRVHGCSLYHAYATADNDTLYRIIFCWPLSKLLSPVWPSFVS